MRLRTIFAVGMVGAISTLTLAGPAARLASATETTVAVAETVAGATDTTVAEDSTSAESDTVVTEGEAGATEGESGATEGEAEAEGGHEMAKEEKECLEILEKGGKVSECQEAPNPILPATDEIVWGTLAFLAILAMLWKFALPAIRKTMAARTAKIEGDLAAAAKTKLDAEKSAQEYTAKIGDARAEGEKIREEARSQAEAIRKDIIARAEADAEAIRAKASEDINAQTARVKSDLQSHVKSLSLDLAEKVVGANMNRDTNAALVDRYIAELSSK